MSNLLLLFFIAVVNLRSSGGIDMIIRFSCETPVQDGDRRRPRTPAV